MELQGIITPLHGGRGPGPAGPPSDSPHGGLHGAPPLPRGLQQAILQEPDVLRCEYLTGQLDFILRVSVSSHAHLQALHQRISRMPGVAPSPATMCWRPSRICDAPAAPRRAPPAPSGAGGPFSAVRTPPRPRKISPLPAFYLSKPGFLDIMIYNTLLSELFRSAPRPKGALSHETTHPMDGLILSLALVMTAVFPTRAAEEGVPFSDFRIDAGGMDFLEQQVPSTSTARTRPALFRWTTPSSTPAP